MRKEGGVGEGGGGREVEGGGAWGEGAGQNEIIIHSNTLNNISYGRK